MKLKLFALVLLLSVCFVENANITKKSYYFKMDQPRNEIKIHNRVHLLNYNLTDFDYNRRPQSMRKALMEPPKSIYEEKDLYLDQEWNFNHTTLNKTELPAYFQKFYDNHSKYMYRNHCTTVRFLFNENANSSSRIIKFNLDSLKENETISEADMYFYWPLKNTSDLHKTSVVLRLYQYEEQNTTESDEESSLKNPDVHKLFNVIYISKAQSGWQSFKIKKALINWLKGEPNFGLVLSISTHGDNKLVSIYNDTNIGKLRTFVAVYIHNNESSPTQQINFPEVANLINLNHSAMLHYTTMCQRKSWYIDFQRLHWNDFVIFPDGYIAFDCFGKCNHEDNVSNNHLKFLYHFRQRTTYCVPGGYLPLPIMYYDEYGNVVLKTYEKMIATDCACK